MPVTEKRLPIGICDHCAGPIPPGQWFHRRGPRLYCSLDCRNTANSRAGNQVRSEKAIARVKAGQWVNPMANLTSEQMSAIESDVARKGRLREVAEGRWRNPGLTPEAREKNRQAHLKKGPG